MKKCLNAIFVQKHQHGENLLTFKNIPLLVDLQRKLIKYQNAPLHKQLITLQKFNIPIYQLNWIKQV